MRPFAHRQESGALKKRLQKPQVELRPNSGVMNNLKGDIKKALVEDNTVKLLGHGSSTWAGVDRFGKELAQPANSTIKSWGHLGRLLDPPGIEPRTITRFNWVGGQWRALICWSGINLKMYHLQGCPKGSSPKRPNWSLPRQDIGGISPKGWVDVRAALKKMAAVIAKEG